MTMMMTMIIIVVVVIDVVAAAAVGVVLVVMLSRAAYNINNFIEQYLAYSCCRNILKWFNYGSGIRGTV